MVKPSEQIQIRIALFGAIALIVMGVLLGRLWYLQILVVDQYKSLAETNRIRLIATEAPRGTIYDRNGNILVANQPSLAVAIWPETITKEPVVLERLASVLGMPLDEARKRLKSKKANPLEPRIIQENVDQAKIAYLKEHQADFPGVEIKVASVRSYPSGSLAAHVLGYVGEVSEVELATPEFKNNTLGDVVGKTGVEKTYNSLLGGVKGEQKVEVDALSRRLRTLRTKEAAAGQNLILSLDRDVQATTEVALQNAIQQAHAQKYPKANAAAAVVIDPKTGEIIAMASYPTYDPSLFVGGIPNELWNSLNNQQSNYPLINRAAGAAYAPGSTFKPITGIAGLTESLVNRQTSFVCAGRWTGLGEKWSKLCWRRSGHGQISFSRAIVESCDVYFYEVGYKFYKVFKSQGKELFQRWINIFGFGETTGVDLTSEVPGRVPTLEWKREWNKNSPDSSTRIWLPGDSVNMAIGQGDLLVTPLQLANAYAAILNGGVLYRPHLGRSHTTADGKIKADFKVEEVGRLNVAPTLLQQVKSDLAGVVTSGTAAGAFAGFPVPAGGKTGTAQVRGKDDFAWFVGFAPVDDPQYVVVVMVEQGGHGGSVAAPAARQILAKIFNVPEQAQVTATDTSR